jgi:quercetin dioxygenase-like cupin family protein
LGPEAVLVTKEAELARMKGQQMIRNGDKLENPVTGEVLIFRRTSRETGGEAVLVETIVRAGGFVAAAHVHPYQTERFEVLDGQLGLRVGGREFVAGPGDVATVPPGTPHRFWNAGKRDARFSLEVRPALEFESLIETMFTLAAEGKTNRKGMPNPLRLAVIARSHFDTVRLPFPPEWLQRAGLAVGAPLGRMLGYRPTVVAAAA